MPSFVKMIPVPPWISVGYTHIQPWPCWGWVSVLWWWTDVHGNQAWVLQIHTSPCVRLSCGSRVAVLKRLGLRYGRPSGWGLLVSQRLSCSFLCWINPGYWRLQTQAICINSCPVDLRMSRAFFFPCLVGTGGIRGSCPVC